MEFGPSIFAHTSLVCLSEEVEALNPTYNDSEFSCPSNASDDAGYSTYGSN